MEERRSRIGLGLILLALLLLTRLPAMAKYLSIDNVNLAFSLEKFDPRIHQPQPPGYPFFVLFARVVNTFVGDPEKTFVAVSLIAGALSLYAAYAFGARMFSRWAGGAAAFLLLVNPVFWQSNLDGPLRPNLALFSLLTAYCCWRCWAGEKYFVYLAAIAFGVGSGFRPDLIAFLFPLWFISSWAGTKSWRSVLRASLLLAGIVTVWAIALIVAMGGIHTFFSVMLGYASEQSARGSVVFGSSLMAWLRQINRLVIWNGLAVIPWIWAVPFSVFGRTSLEASPYRARASRHPLAFFFVWLVPGWIIQALTHAEEPGHTLFSVAALCVLGGYVLSRLGGRDFALSGAILVSAFIFLEVGDLFSLPERTGEASDGTPSMKNAILFGSFESSLAQVRWLDDMTRLTLQEIAEFTPKDRPAIIISTDGYVDHWFVNWRIGRYYLPKQDFWILYNTSPLKHVEHIRRDKVLETGGTRPLEIPIFREGRILWLVEPGSKFHKEVAAVQNLSGGKYVFYSDITAESSSFMIDGFQIVPTS
jgi:Dolichyl-phosphate-mannose-protein mannosyltransferase